MGVFLRGERLHRHAIGDVPANLPQPIRDFRVAPQRVASVFEGFDEGERRIPVRHRAHLARARRADVYLTGNRVEGTPEHPQEHRT